MLTTLSNGVRLGGQKSPGVSLLLFTQLWPCLLDLGSQTEITNPDVATWVPVVQTQSSCLPHHQLVYEAISPGLQASNFLSLMTLSNSSRHYDCSENEICVWLKTRSHICIFSDKTNIQENNSFKTPMLSKKEFSENFLVLQVNMLWLKFNNKNNM